MNKSSPLPIDDYHAAAFILMTESSPLLTEYYQAVVFILMNESSPLRIDSYQAAVVSRLKVHHCLESTTRLLFLFS